jgi:hypothetical protein
MVDAQHVDGDAANWRSPDQPGLLPSKVFRPIVPARMKQPDKPPGIWIEARDVRTLVAVAIEAGKGEVFIRGSPTVFLRNNVVELEREFRKGGGKLALLAAQGGSAADRFLQQPIHRDSGGCPVTCQRASSLGFQ